MKTKRQTFTYLAGVPFLIAVSLVPAVTLWASSMEGAAQTSQSIATVQSAYGQLPLSFEANHGQWDPSVQFVTRGRGHQLFLTSTEAVLTMRTGSAQTNGRADHATPSKPLSSPSPLSHSVVRMKFAGADPQAEMVGLDQLPGIVNYFIGDDPSKWHTNIPTYQKVGYKDLYPGIDLVYYGNQGQLEYDLVVAPGADPNQIMLAFDGTEQIAVDEQGDLVLTLPQPSTETAEGAAPTLRLHKPVVYQRDEQGEKHVLAGTYVLRAAETVSAHPTVALHPQKTQQVAFQVASYDASKPLIIDPVLSWATYLGGSAGDDGSGIAADGAGQTYVTGSTGSTDFPTATPLQATLTGRADVFVTKLNAAGTALLYSTYLGGSLTDLVSGIAVDGAGQAYLTGLTDSTDFPTATPLQATLGGPQDAFVTKLSATGTALLYSTYLGGSNDEVGSSIAVDGAGQAYVTGLTWSTNFPTAAPIQATLAGVSDAFVSKLSAAGASLLYSTYLGGSGGDEGSGIAVDGAGQAYVTGTTESTNFPTAAPLQATLAGVSDAFVTKLNASGTAHLYSTYLGGSTQDAGSGIAVDGAGQAYVTGLTWSTDFPTAAPLQATLAGMSDAFVTKFNAAGTSLLYSTYLGGSLTDLVSGIAVDGAGQAYVTGNTPSTNFPTAAPLQATLAGGVDAFVTKFNAAGTSLLYSTYLGGSNVDVGRSIAVDGAGQAYVTGGTNSTNFPTTTPLQATLAGAFDAFVAKITGTTIVNDLVTFVPLTATYRTTADPTGCPSGFVGKFSFDARLTNKNSSPPLSDLAVQVKTLTNGNLLQNADGGNGGVGSTATVLKQNGYSDGTLSRSEFVDVHFSICLKERKPFSFFVDVLGMRQE